MDISPLPDIGNEVLVERSKAHVDPSTVPVICGSGWVDEGKAGRGEDTVEDKERRRR